MATAKQTSYILSLLQEAGYSVRFMDKGFKALGVSMRDRSGSVEGWAKNLNSGEASGIIDQLKAEIAEKKPAPAPEPIPEPKPAKKSRAKKPVAPATPSPEDLATATAAQASLDEARAIVASRDADGAPLAQAAPDHTEDVPPIPATVVGIPEPDETVTIERMAEERHERAAAARPQVDEDVWDAAIPAPPVALAEIPPARPADESPLSDDLVVATPPSDPLPLPTFAIVDKSRSCPACADPTLGVHTCGKIETPRLPIVIPAQESNPDIAALDAEVLLRESEVKDIETELATAVRRRDESRKAYIDACAAQGVTCRYGAPQKGKGNPVAERVFFEVALDGAPGKVRIGIKGRPETLEVFAIADHRSSNALAAAYCRKHLGDPAVIGNKAGSLGNRLRELFPLAAAAR